MSEGAQSKAARRDDKRLLWALLAVVFALLLNAMVASEPVCVPAPQIQSSEQAQHHQRGESVPGWIVAVYSPFCSAGYFIITHKGVIDGLSTFIIAAFTIILAWSTIRLWKETERLAEGGAEQSRKMADSIREAARSASAMEKVSDGIATNVETTTEMAKTQREFWQHQMRAYLTVITGSCVPQDRTTDWKYEVRMYVRNTGNTPAHAVTVNSRLRLLEFPLPDSADLTLPPVEYEAAGHIMPGQQFFFRAWLEDFLSDEEIETIRKGQTPKLYIFGTVRYRDIFGNERHTNFCQFAVWDVANNFATINANRHNDAT